MSVLTPGQFSPTTADGGKRDVRWMTRFFPAWYSVFGIIICLLTRLCFLTAAFHRHQQESGQRSDGHAAEVAVGEHRPHRHALHLVDHQPVGHRGAAEQDQQYRESDLDGQMMLGEEGDLVRSGDVRPRWRRDGPTATPS